MTPGQRAKFFPLIAKAWMAHCYYADQDSKNRKAMETWRRSELKKATGRSSSKGLSLEAFEKAMVHFASIAQDDRELAYWITAAERRMRHNIEAALRLLAWYKKETITWTYARGILEHMRLPDSLQDLPVDNLQHVLIALDTHFRRLCERNDERPVDAKKRFTKLRRLDQSHTS